MHFSMELSKKLDVWYKSPPLPVDLSFMNGTTLPFNLTPPSADGGATTTRGNPDTVGDTTASPDLSNLHNQFRPQFDWQR